MAENKEYYEIPSLLYDVLKRLEELKPKDRSETDRRFAIVITELEKIIAYYDYYVL